MAKLADAADLKSAGPKGLWGFDSPSRHHLTAAFRPNRPGSLTRASLRRRGSVCGLLRRVYLVPSVTLADSDKSAGFTDILVKYGKNGVTSRGILSAGLSSVTCLEVIISI
jgi:hypothetical protein